MIALDLPLRAQAPAEYQVKAAFLYNFAKFVEWPAADSHSTFCIGILGTDPFGHQIEETLAGKTLNGRPVTITRYARPEEALACQVVFVAAPAASLKSVLRLLGEKAVLTVGDAPSFCQSGGIIGFQVADQKIRFAINVEAAERAQLKLSSKLLSLAAEVVGKRR